MDEVIVAGVVFFGVYHILKLISDHFLRRKLIKGGHIEQPGILERPKPVNDEVDKYPSLKWGLVALMTGLGFVVMELLRLFDKDWFDGRDAVLPIGILLIFVSLGFLIYFFFMNGKKK